MRRLRNRKFTNHKKRMIYFSLFVLLLLISIGYAYLSAALSINGNTTIVANTWDIHFENLTITNGSVTASTPAAINGNSTSISYTVLLSKPGDFYEFEVDTVNAGTIPAKISLVDIQGISSAAEPYLEYSIKYTTGADVQVNDLLNPDSEKRIVVRVGYKEDLNSLPEDDIPLNLTFTIHYIQTTEEENVGNLLQRLAKDNTCITKYEGEVTDKVGVTENATNVYFDKCADKRNVIFGGFCWQIIRSTETGGIKMIYNGEPDQNGECGSDRSDHKGIYQLEGSSNQTMSGSYIYGSSFTYDISSGEFTLTDTTTATWSDSTYEDLIGKFTCKSTSTTCTTIYEINGYESNSQAIVTKYGITDVHYSLIGNTSFNGNSEVVSSAGYMFNKAYVYQNQDMNSNTNTYRFGSEFTYNENTNTYTLSGTIQDIGDWGIGEDNRGKLSSLSNTHYTCWNDTGTCTTISYIFKSSVSSRFSSAGYITLDGGKNINDALDDMLWGDDVNRYNSPIKGVVDAWYRHNMTDKTSMLEDTIFCNSREPSRLGGWNPNGGDPFTLLYYKNNTDTLEMTCAYETDQFSISNNKARLTYPMGLLQYEEWLNIGTNSLMATGSSYWLMSPIFFSGEAYILYVYAGGSSYNGSPSYVRPGIRPVVSLASSVTFSSGEGSETDPWIVE